MLLSPSLWSSPLSPSSPQPSDPPFRALFDDLVASDDTERFFPVLGAIAAALFPVMAAIVAALFPAALATTSGGTSFPSASSWSFLARARALGRESYVRTLGPGGIHLRRLRFYSIDGDGAGGRVDGDEQKTITKNNRKTSERASGRFDIIKCLGFDG